MQLGLIKPQEMKESLNILDNMHNIFKSGQGAGASGAFFFFSSDKKYIIKTMRGTEKQVLLKIIDDMILHFKQESRSLIAKIYGMYTISTNKFAPVDIIIMQNTQSTINKKNELITFDLKGSLYKRKVQFPNSERSWWL